MERKIGEIFEYNGEWYQCVEGGIYCPDCVFFRKKCNSQVLGECAALKRSDKENVIFKKLEKVGEPYKALNRLFQAYKVFTAITDVGNYDVAMIPHYETIDIEIKQTKEDMEEKKLKPFDLEAAKLGKPVCTRDGRKARVLCYDFKQNEEYPILVAVENKHGKECALLYSNDGISEMYKSSNNELVMFPMKRTGYINIYDNNRVCEKIFETEEKAEIAANSTPDKYIKTIKIEWEE